MRTSEDGIALIAHYEGFSDVVYLCPANKPTIGYGHVVREGEEFPDKITKDFGVDLLKKDVAYTEKVVSFYVKPLMTQNQFDALVSFTFNVGPGNFRTSTLLKKINKEDFEGAANEFQRWKYAGGRVLNGLIKRREAETALFRKE